MKTFLEFLSDYDHELLIEAKKKNWISGIIKKPGSFTNYCGGEVTNACIAKGKKSKNPKTRKRANLAANFRKMNYT
jgi:hypothetical protein